MIINVGSMEADARLVAGSVILAAGVYWQSWWGLLGAALIVSGHLRWCPLYRLLRLSTFGFKIQHAEPLRKEESNHPASKAA